MGICVITRPELAFLGFESTPHEAGERKAALVLSSLREAAIVWAGIKSWPIWAD